MAGMTNATKETAALAVTGLGGWISLHTADPGTTGTDEATGGSPAYARVQTTWSGGSSDGIVVGSGVTIDVPAGTYTHVGVWTASTAGTFIGSTDINGGVGVTVSTQSQVLVTPTFTES